MASSNVQIGLRAYQTILSAQPTPQQVLESPLPVGRHMITIINLDDNSLIGGVDMFLASPDNLVFVQSTPNISVSGPGNWAFSGNVDGVSLIYDFNGGLWINTITETIDVLVKEFIIPVAYTGENIYACDTIIANNPATGSAVNCTSPFAVSYTGANPVNLGQAIVTQETSITTAVTVNAASGQVVTVSSTLASNNSVSFVVNNSAVSSTSIVVVSVCNYTGTGIPYVSISSVTNGSFTINLTNLSSGISPPSLNAPVAISFICA